MILNHLPLDENERTYFRVRHVSDADLEAILKLTDESHEQLWTRILPQGLTNATAVPRDHWSNDIQTSGPSYPRPSLDDNTTVLKSRENQWRTELKKFFVGTFEFDFKDVVFIADYGGAYVTNWATFVSNPDAFCPWHDATLIIKRDSPQFARLVEDYHWVGQGARPAIPGFDSKRFCTEHMGPSDPPESSS